jgi:hypothetical protein
MKTNMKWSILRLFRFPGFKEEVVAFQGRVERMPVTIAVIDGIGRGIDAQIVELLKTESLKGVSVIALGTNAVATQRMMNAGADKGTSGENAIRTRIRRMLEPRKQRFGSAGLLLLRYLLDNLGLK